MTELKLSAEKHGGLPEFRGFPKIPRLFRDIVITEKLDGTHAEILITGEGIFAGGRSRWLHPRQPGQRGPDPDQNGFAAWVGERADDLAAELGPGSFHGEWWGHRINRGYGLDHKRFSLFRPPAGWEPKHCHVVPALFEGAFCTEAAEAVLQNLEQGGSWAAPGFMKPEGIVIHHTASGHLYKATLEGDGVPKGRVV